MTKSKRPAEGVSIRRLYKIFGRDPQRHIEAVRGGMTKAELQQHDHVLGLRDINLEMAAGGIHVIMGLSGSGKSTLIRHINRLIEPTAGEILIGGTDIMALSARDLRAFRRSRTAMVFQKFALLPHRTILQNALYGLELRGVSQRKCEETARYWISRVGLNGFEDRYPNQLSGGMQQRVGLARALASDAPILLMDEAYSALDPLIRLDMQGMLLDLQKEIRKTIIFITHDLDEALRLGDSIAVLRDGEVIQQGSGQDIVLRPANDYIESFVKEVNRAKVVRIGAIASGAVGGTEPSIDIDADTLIEDAARQVTSAGVSRIRVLDKTGRPIGQVGLDALLAAMVNHKVA